MYYLCFIIGTNSIFNLKIYVIMENLVSADEKMASELNLSKLAEKALSYVQKRERIENIARELKILMVEVQILESELLPQIGKQYKPKNLDFILQPKIFKGRKTTLYANVVKVAPKSCNFTTKQLEVFNELITDNTKIGENKKTIQIIKE